MLKVFRNILGGICWYYLYTLFIKNSSNSFLKSCWYNRSNNRPRSAPRKGHRDSTRSRVGGARGPKGKPDPGPAQKENRTQEANTAWAVLMGSELCSRAGQGSGLSFGPLAPTTRQWVGCPRRQTAGLFSKRDCPSTRRPD